MRALQIDSCPALICLVVVNHHTRSMESYERRSRFSTEVGVALHHNTPHPTLSTFPTTVHGMRNCLSFRTEACALLFWGHNCQKSLFTIIVTISSIKLIWKNAKKKRRRGGKELRNSNKSDSQLTLSRGSICIREQHLNTINENACKRGREWVKERAREREAESKRKDKTHLHKNLVTFDVYIVYEEYTAAKTFYYTKLIVQNDHAGIPCKVEGI